MESIRKKNETQASYSSHDILKSTELFSNIEPKLLDLFAAESVIKSYPKGSVLFLHEESAEFFYVIASGWVKLFRATLDGEEAVIDVLNDGNIFGENSIFDNDKYSYGAQTVEDTTLLSLPISLLRQKIEESNNLSIQMLSSMSRSRKQRDKEIEHMSLQNAPQRIGCFILRLCDPDLHEKITLHLPYDKTLIASRLGMKPETFSRALTRLRNETDIRINGSTVEIDNIEKLSHYSCSACSSSYPCEDLS